MGAKNIENYLIQYGVDSNYFKYKPKREIESFNINKKNFILFSPRGLSPEYNIDSILKSLSLLKKNGLKFKCIFAFNYGDKILNKYIDIATNLNIADSLIWLGYVKYENMQDLYNLSDAVISFPLIDSSPKCVYEALFCKANVIVSDLHWSYDFLKNEIIRVESNNHLKLYEKLKEIYNHRDLKKIDIEKNYSRILDHYDYERNMKKIEKIMKDKIK